METGGLGLSPPHPTPPDSTWTTGPQGGLFLWMVFLAAPGPELRVEAGWRIPRGKRAGSLLSVSGPRHRPATV